MATYALNPNGMLDTSDELRGVTRSISNAIDALNDEVMVFISANEGEAKNAFETAQRHWQAGMANMNATLEHGAVRLDDIHDTFRLGDVRGAALFQGHV